MLIRSPAVMIYDATDDIVSGANAPDAPAEGMLWLDTSGTPLMLKRYDGAEWVDCGADQGILAELKGEMDKLSQTLTDTEEALRQSIFDETGKCVTDAEYAEYKQSQSAVLEGLGSSLQLSLDEIRGTVSGLGEDYQTITETFAADANGLTIGRVSSPFKVQITHERINFLQDGQPVAYISNAALVITNARVSRSFRVGGFAWRTLADGSMGLVLEEDG